MPTRITEIHGIPANETTDRGRMVSASAPYIPYTSMTQGEMKLALLADEAAVMASAYPEMKSFQQVADLYKKALATGISGGVNFVGAMYDVALQQAARNIKNASRQTRPAAGVLLNRPSLLQGIGIGEIPLFTGSFDHDCTQFATKAANQKFGRNRDWTWWKGVFPQPEEKKYWQAQKAICETKVAIEQIMNERMVDTAHHLLYKSLSDSFGPIIGTQVLNKKLYHTAGISGLSNVADISYNLMDGWAEASVLRKNSASGAGAFGSMSSSLSISPDPGQLIFAYNAHLTKIGKQRSGGAIQGIGFVAAVGAITALVAAIGAAIAKAAEFQHQLNAKKAGALATVVGYGTPSLEAKTSDYLSAGNGNGDAAGEKDNTLLFIGLGLGAAYLLTEK